jgi:hypothetical protein
LSRISLPDGLKVLRDVIKLSEVMRLIEHTARWVDPETFRILPLWYPEHARRTDFYTKNWSEPLRTKIGRRVTPNTNAREMLTPTRL